MGKTDEERTYRLLGDNHVVVQPGFFFDFLQGERLVASLFPLADEFAEGVCRVARRIAGRAWPRLVMDRRWFLRGY